MRSRMMADFMPDSVFSGQGEQAADTDKSVRKLQTTRSGRFFLG
jgi:hypothetical protein